jgi:hypothetical protein
VNVYDVTDGLNRVAWGHVTVTAGEATVGEAIAAGTVASAAAPESSAATVAVTGRGASFTRVSGSR